MEWDLSETLIAEAMQKWPTMMSVEEVAKLLNVHRQTVMRTIKQGLLPSVKLEGEVLQVSRQDLLSYLNSVSNLNLP